MTTAAVTMQGDQVQLTFSVAKPDVPYSVVETALVQEGFADYMITRYQYDQYTDFTINIFVPRTPLTNLPIPFPANATMLKLANAAGKFGA